MAASLLLTALAATALSAPPVPSCPKEATLQVADPARPAALLRPQDRRGPSGASQYSRSLSISMYRLDMVVPQKLCSP